jgi:hypothetical protein
MHPLLRRLFPPRYELTKDELILRFLWTTTRSRARTSSELSGDPAQPGSAAYEITEWARKSTT